VKFLLNIEFLPSGSIDFTTSEKAKNSPLIEALLAVTGMKSVMIGTNFVSITKQADAGWETVLEHASNTIKDMASSDAVLIDPVLITLAQEKGKGDSAIVQRIKQILDDEIRPAIAMDGGDCQFEGYDEGIVTLQLQGACSSCPSATMTLKLGIENRLREEIPEIIEVVQV
jgi:Fe-S cluster biogenesis protein NfuA